MIIISQAVANALDKLYEAAVDTAEFAAGHPTGRSRTASLCRLKAALEAVDDAMVSDHLPYVRAVADPDGGERTS